MEKIKFQNNNIKNFINNLNTLKNTYDNIEKSNDGVNLNHSVFTYVDFLKKNIDEIVIENKIINKKKEKLI